MPFTPAGCKLMLDLLTGVVTAAPDIEISLHTSNPSSGSADELTTSTAPGYARQTIAPGAARWTSAADSDSGDTTTDGAVTFPVATGDWPASITHAGGYADIGGASTLIFYDDITLTSPDTGERARIPAGDIDLSIPIA